MNAFSKLCAFQVQRFLRVWTLCPNQESSINEL